MNRIILGKKGNSKTEMLLSVFGRFVRKRPAFKAVASVAMPALALIGLPDIVVSIPLQDIDWDIQAHVVQR